MPRIRMSDPVSRYELNSKLAAQDARLDSAMHQMLGIATRIDQTCERIHADNKELRRTMIVTGIAVILGVAAFNSSVCSDVVAGFQAGLAAEQLLKPKSAPPPLPSTLTPGPFLAAPVQ